MAQTTMAPQVGQPYAGVCDEARSVGTATSEEDTAEIPYGVMVQDGDEDDGALLLTDQGNSLKGISVKSNAAAKPTELGDTGLKPLATFGILREGTVWVQPEGNVAPGDGVHVRAIAGMGEQAGTFRADADGSDTIDISAFARWRTTGSSTVRALLEINMANAFLAEAY